MWAFGRRAGFYAGLCISTCVGLFLFTRILIPDVMLTLTIALAMWAFLRAAGRRRAAPAPLGVRRWPPASASGLLLKSAVAVLFPGGGGG